MRLLHALALAGAVSVAPLTVRAQQQVGTLDERTAFGVVTGSGIGTAHGPLLAIVLWRGEPGWMRITSDSDRARNDSSYRMARRRGEDAELFFFGSGKTHAFVDRAYHRLIVEGREFPLAPSDSTLVVMVTVPPGEQPRTVQTARISSALPADYWSKIWYHGDTTFIVHTSLERTNVMLLDALRQSSTVAAFLR